MASRSIAKKEGLLDKCSAFSTTPDRMMEHCWYELMVSRLIAQREGLLDKCSACLTAPRKGVMMGCYSKP
jgi:hypothetical protein